MQISWNCCAIATAMLGAAVAHAEVKEFKLPTAADGDVEFKVDSQSRLPIPAKDERMMMTQAAFAILPFAKGAPITCTWQYSIQFDPKFKPTSVLIEDEKGHQLVQVVRDDHPEIRDGVWSGAEASIKLDKGLFEAMNGPDPWVLLRRITVAYSDGSQSKMHQMVIETQPMRVDLLRRTMDAMKAQKPAQGGGGS